MIEVQKSPSGASSTPPRVTSIERHDPTTSRTSANSVTWRVTFDEDVANVDEADFAVRGTTAAPTVAAMAGSSSVYDVTASGGDLAHLNATVTLSITDARDIANTRGGVLTETTPTGTNDNSFEVDNTAPTVTSIERHDPAASRTGADRVTWRVTFDEAVANVNAADFAVRGTTAPLSAAAMAGSSSVYDVTAGGGDLAHLNATVTLSFAGARTITDTVGNALARTTPTGANDNSFEVINIAPTAPTVPTAPSCSSHVRVPADWALKPSGLSAGDTFRLLFVTSRTTRARPRNLHYNTYVQNAAGGGHTAIRDYRSWFRVLGSTQATDARDNTCTSGAGGDPVYWLNGDQVADDNADLYDSNWDNEGSPKTEQGSATGRREVWTGSSSNGTTDFHLGGGSCVAAGRLNGAGGPLFAGCTASSNYYPLYGLSLKFQVATAAQRPRATAVRIVSSPVWGDTYRAGESIEFEVTFSEAVTVIGAPELALGPKNAAETYHRHLRARYARGTARRRWSSP